MTAGHSRRLALGALGLLLIVASLGAHSVVSAGSESSAAQTRVCLGDDYSLQDGCRSATHQLTPPEFGRAYVVTDVGERDGVDQYELLYRSADGTMEQVAVRQTTTGKVPRYVLSLADLSSQAPGPPKTGEYELVTTSGGQQSSYVITVVDEKTGSVPATTTGSTTGSTVPTGLGS